MKIHFSPNILFIIPADTTKKQFYTCDIQGRTGGGHRVHVPPIRVTSRGIARPVYPMCDGPSAFYATNVRWLELCQGHILSEKIKLVV